MYLYLHNSTSFPIHVSSSILQFSVLPHLRLEAVQSGKYHISKISTRLHGVTSQTKEFFIVTVVRAANVTGKLCPDQWQLLG